MKTTKYDHGALVAIRRDLHAHPELRFEEKRTSARVAEMLEADGWTVQSGIAGTGLLATWGTGNSGQRVLVRADMDAYPVHDAKRVPYCSTNTGVTHACGHDVHMTVVLGLARAILDRPKLRDSVTLMFQPAEEIPFGEASGARAMIDSGALGVGYDAVLGLHCWPQLDAGVVGVDSAAAMAAKDAFRIAFSGISAHVATPASGRDAMLAASTAVLGLHAAIGRERNPSDLAAFNLGTIQGGRSQSSLPARVEITGTLRTHDEKVRKRLKQTIARVAAGAAQQVGVDHDILWANEMPILENADWLVDLALETLPKSGIEAVRIGMPPLTTDDFALLGELGPLLYVKLGVGTPGAVHTAPLHSGDFDVEESCLDTGVNAMFAILERLVEV